VKSALYTGSVRHRRFAERERSFSHRVALAYVDLDELESLPPSPLVRFRRDDYFGAGELADAVRARIAAEAGSAPAGPVRMLANLRSFGHCFNPVSFYYCFDREERLQALLAEVTNTPWGERQSYVLTRGERAGAVLRGESEKLMHVSPFFGMDQRYDWRVAEPGTTLSVHIENREHGELAFDATLALKRRKLTRTSLAATAAASLRTLALIYTHAAAIRLSGIRTKPRPERGTAYPEPRKTGTVPYA
jgi:uncharacterized protein